MRKALLPFLTIVVATAVGCSGDGSGPAPQVPTTLVKAAGDGQTGVVAADLTTQLGVRLTDQDGNPITNEPVSFTVTAGGGSVTPTSAPTDNTGLAQVTWTLGQTAGAQTARASVGSLTPVDFSATAQPGPAVALVVVSGDGQDGTVGQNLPSPVVVKAQDAFGNGVAGKNVVWTVTSAGGGSFTASSPTNSNGTTLSTWKLRNTPGANTATATVSGLNPLQLSATGEVGAPDTVVKVSGDNQAASFNTALSDSLVVRVEDSLGNAIVGTDVTFAVASGGGSVAPTTVTTDANGEAVTYWTLGPTNGIQTVTASVAGGVSNTFQATGVDPAGGPNYLISGLYLVQSIQDLDRSVPLVADRDAFVRVFVTSDQPTTLIPDVDVRFYENGSLVHTERITGTATTMPTAVAEGSLSNSWNATIDGSFITPNTTVVAEVDPDDAFNEGVEGDNLYPASGTPMSINAKALPVFQVAFVPILQDSNGTTGLVNAGNMESYVTHLRKVLPVDSLTYSLHAAYESTLPVVAADGTNWSDLLSEIEAVRTGEGLSGRVYGVMHLTYTSGVVGLGYVGGFSAIGLDGASPWNFPIAAETYAHETGHNLSLTHAPGCGAGNPDSNYPNADGTIGDYGYDSGTGNVMTPSRYDLMSYCNPTWISGYSFSKALNYRLSAGQNVATSAGARQPVVIVWGTVHGDEVRIQPAFSSVAPPVLPDGRGDFVLRGESESGFAFEYRFTPMRMGDTNDRGFAFAIPATQAAQLTRLTVRHAGRDFSRSATQAPAAAPTPQGMAPAAAAVQLRAERVGDRVRVRWDRQRFPLLVVRDGDTGEIVSLARGGDARIRTGATRFHVEASNGVRSVTQRVEVR